MTGLFVEGCMETVHIVVGAATYIPHKQYSEFSFREGELTLTHKAS